MVELRSQPDHSPFGRYLAELLDSSERAKALTTQLDGCSTFLASHIGIIEALLKAPTENHKLSWNRLVTELPAIVLKRGAADLDAIIEDVRNISTMRRPPQQLPSSVPSATPIDGETDPEMV